MAEAACAELVDCMDTLAVYNPGGRGGWGKTGGVDATWAASKGRFDGQKGKDYGYRDQHDGWKGRFTWYQSTDD